MKQPKSSELRSVPSTTGFSQAGSPAASGLTEIGTEPSSPSLPYSLSASDDSNGWLTSPTDPLLRFQSDGHQYWREGVELLSLSRLLELGGFTSDFSKIPPEVLARKTAIGQSVHRAIWLHIHDDLDWDQLGEDLYGYVKAAARYLESRDSAIRWTELPFGSTDLGYACTPDVVYADGYVEEWKTTYKIYRKVRIQLAGQARAVNPDSPGGRRVVLLKPDGSYQQEEYDDAEDFEILEAARRVALWRQQNDK